MHCYMCCALGHFMEDLRVGKARELGWQNEVRRRRGRRRGGGIVEHLIGLWQDKALHRLEGFKISAFCLSLFCSGSDQSVQLFRECFSEVLFIDAVLTAAVFFFHWSWFVLHWPWWVLIWSYVVYLYYENIFTHVWAQKAQKIQELIWVYFHHKIVICAFISLIVKPAPCIHFILQRGSG